MLAVFERHLLRLPQPIDEERHRGTEIILAQQRVLPGGCEGISIPIDVLQLGQGQGDSPAMNHFPEPGELVL